jgi:hypothetical protein
MGGSGGGIESKNCDWGWGGRPRRQQQQQAAEAAAAAAKEIITGKAPGKWGALPEKKPKQKSEPTPPIAMTRSSVLLLCSLVLLHKGLLMLPLNPAAAAAAAPAPDLTPIPQAPSLPEGPLFL